MHVIHHCDIMLMRHIRNWEGLMMGWRYLMKRKRLWKVPGSGF
jgi:hypothetical protein